METINLHKMNHSELSSVIRELESKGIEFDIFSDDIDSIDSRIESHIEYMNYENNNMTMEIITENKKIN